ncbi:FadR/GntR family transcriptional regulator [Glaciibacter superstes]|uniref:FadR/GntR family transcriptional regulator n=1 Tax=Glaciibacter superstes TaxID=501023 RepID=UPI0003B3F591|nr:FadR/GntR family transcriptional regulator [Glaciibacter superstes]
MALAEEVAEQLLDSILDGVIPATESLPAEAELAASFGVSRLTVREAVRILRTQGIVHIQRGRGTAVNPPEKWTSLDAIVRASAGRMGRGGHVSERLLEARRMIEVGAAQLAAVRRSADDLVALEENVDGMRIAAKEQRVDDFVFHDIAFHDVIMRASGNLFVPVLFSTFGRLLIETRRQTSAVPAIQWNAIEHHVAIADAMRSGDEQRASVTMEAHMDQTQRDLRHHVMGEASHV